MDSTNAGDGQKSNDSLRNHGQVDRHGVTLLHTHLLQDPGGPANLTKQLTVGEVAALIWLVGLVNDGHTVWILGCMTIDTVVRGVQSALQKVGVVAVLQ